MRVAIAGCGIAGLASAVLLARAGHQVELFERFVEPQPIGSGLIVQSLSTRSAPKAHLHRSAAVTSLMARCGRMSNCPTRGSTPLPSASVIGAQV